VSAAGLHSGREHTAPVTVLSCSTTNSVVQMRGVTLRGIVLNAVRALVMLSVVVGWPWFAFPGQPCEEALAQALQVMLKCPYNELNTPLPLHFLRPGKSLAFGVVPWCIFSLLFMISSQVRWLLLGDSALCLRCDQLLGILWMHQWLALDVVLDTGHCQCGM
jgi:hypothetical protein